MLRSRCLGFRCKSAAAEKKPASIFWAANLSNRLRGALCCCSDRNLRSERPGKGPFRPSLNRGSGAWGAGGAGGESQGVAGRTFHKTNRHNRLCLGLFVPLKNGGGTNAENTAVNLLS